MSADPTQTDHPYEALQPDVILNAVETLGYTCDGRLQALNSYENRVFQVGLEEGGMLVVKFYRPARWTDAAIREEHAFTHELVQAELPVLAPLEGADGQSLYEAYGFRFAVYKNQGGRAPELDRPEDLTRLGRCLARLHSIGALHDFQHRPALGIQSHGYNARDTLLECGLLPDDVRDSYEAIADHILAGIERCYERAGRVRHLRLHGDCHPGNILLRDETLWLLDFDDCCSGPAIQDLWLFLSGDREFMTARLHDLLKGYREFRDFDPRELHLVEALRALRMLHHAAWLARRWDDPAFPQAFPYFNTRRYWDDYILGLREQAGQLDEPPLEWLP